MRTVLGIGLCAATLALAGCGSTMDERAATGALGGAAVGAATTGSLGGTAAGAVLGGGAGAVYHETRKGKQGG